MFMLFRFKNGITKLLTHPTSMEVPIFNSLYFDYDKSFKFENIDFSKLNKLNFKK